MHFNLLRGVAASRLGDLVILGEQVLLCGSMLVYNPAIPEHKQKHSKMDGRSRNNTDSAGDHVVPCWFKILRAVWSRCCMVAKQKPISILPNLARRSHGSGTQAHQIITWSAAKTPTTGAHKMCSQPQGCQYPLRTPARRMQ